MGLQNKKLAIIGCIIIFIAVVFLIVGIAIIINLNQKTKKINNSLSQETSSNPLTTSSPGTPISKARDERIKSNIKLTEIELQIYFQQRETFVGADTQQEVRNYMADIASQGSELKMNLTPTTYLLYAKLNDNNYYCADNNAFRDVIKTISPSWSTCQGSTSTSGEQSL